jgi:heat shock protein 4
MEDWLYGEGEDSTKSVYSEKLAELQKLGNPISLRYRQFEERPVSVNALRKTIEHWKQFAASTDPKYEHIVAEDRAKITAECDKKTEWLSKQLKLQDSKPKHTDPVLLVADLKREREALDAFATPIMNKPKPKPKETPKPPSPTKAAPTAAANGASKPADNIVDEPMAGVDSSAADVKPAAEMDVD